MRARYLCNAQEGTAQDTVQSIGRTKICLQGLKFERFTHEMGAHLNQRTEKGNRVPALSLRISPPPCEKMTLFPACIPKRGEWR